MSSPAFYFLTFLVAMGILSLLLAVWCLFKERYLSAMGFAGAGFLNVVAALLAVNNAPQLGRDTLLCTWLGLWFSGLFALSCAGVVVQLPRRLTLRRRLSSALAGVRPASKSGQRLFWQATTMMTRVIGPRS